MGHIRRGLDKSARRRLYLSTRRRSRRQIARRILKTNMKNELCSASSKSWSTNNQVISKIISTYTTDAVTSISGSQIEFKTEIPTKNGLLDIGDIKKEPELSNCPNDNQAVSDSYYQIETEYAKIKSEDMHHAIDIKEDVLVAESELDISEVKYLEPNEPGNKLFV